MSDLIKIIVLMICFTGMFVLSAVAHDRDIIRNCLNKEKVTLILGQEMDCKIKDLK